MINLYGLHQVFLTIQKYRLHRSGQSYDRWIVYVELCVVFWKRPVEQLVEILGMVNNLPVLRPMGEFDRRYELRGKDWCIADKASMRRLLRNAYAVEKYCAEAETNFNVSAPSLVANEEVGLSALVPCTSSVWAGV